jgi:hypothetical protein
MCLCVANYSSQQRLRLVLLKRREGLIILSLVQWFGGGGSEWTHDKINNIKSIASPPGLDRTSWSSG